MTVAALEVEPPDLVTLAPCRFLVVRCPVRSPCHRAPRLVANASFIQGCGNPTVPPAEVAGARRASDDASLRRDREAARLDPKDADFYSNRGAAWEQKGEYDRAIADFSEAIHLDPADPSPFYNRGIAWRSKGDIDRAIADFSEAIRLDPKDGDYYESCSRAWNAKAADNARRPTSTRPSAFAPSNNRLLAADRDSSAK